MNELLIIRHAIAEERRHDTADTTRALTQKGQDKMEQASQGLIRLLCGIDRIFTSPLVRATQTTAIVSAQYPEVPVATLQLLAPGTESGELIRFLRGLSDNRIALVGHEPGLSHLAATLICTEERSSMMLKKGGMALLHFPGPITPGDGILKWLLTPKQLRLIGKSG